MIDDQANRREQQHAKLLNYRNQQALAFMQRDESDALSIIVQLWCAATDEQLRVSVSVPDSDDAVMQGAFDDMNDESVTQFLDALGVPATLGAARG